MKNYFFFAAFAGLMLCASIAYGQLRSRLADTNHKAGERMTLTIKNVEYALRWCPAGTFTMGSPESEKLRENDESQHRVTLSRGFWLLETPVTQSMWESVMGHNPSHFNGDKLPVERVSWNDCQAYIKKLNGVLARTPGVPAGFRFSLPTEAQWEYACRAGTTTAYSFGDTLNEEQANFGNNVKQTSEVGKYPANAWGLFDMHGNVCEWCSVWYWVYPDGTVTDPNPVPINPGRTRPGPTPGSCRVARGGCWSSDAKFCRSASRGEAEPSDKDFMLGLRLALVSASK